MSVINSHALLALLTAIGIALTILGVMSLRGLLRTPVAQTLKSTDPFSRTIAILFTTGISDANFRRRQRRTIWLFCGAMLVLYLARLLVIKAQV